jgi:hypothetical protein
VSDVDIIRELEARAVAAERRANDLTDALRAMCEWGEYVMDDGKGLPIPDGRAAILAARAALDWHQCGGCGACAWLNEPHRPDCPALDRQAS